MITDEKRREVAKSLRSVAKVAKIREKKARSDVYATWMVLSTAITGRIAFCNISDVFDALADLIEPSFHCDEHNALFDDDSIEWAVVNEVEVIA